MLKANTPIVVPRRRRRQAAGRRKPVLGKVTGAAAAPGAGKPFTFTLAVKRSDTGAPLNAGTLAGTPSLAGKPISHTESFSGGKARLSLVIPKTAKGKQLQVKITITAPDPDHQPRLHLPGALSPPRGGPAAAGPPRS